jgi:hypothetical protein
MIYVNEGCPVPFQNAPVACKVAHRALPAPRDVEATGMQVRSKAYLRMISRLRALRALLSPSEDPTAQEASPLLIYIAVVLALFLAMLEVDLHSAELRSLGLTGALFPIDAVFVSP